MTAGAPGGGTQGTNSDQANSAVGVPGGIATGTGAGSSPTVVAGTEGAGAPRASAIGQGGTGAGGAPPAQSRSGLVPVGRGTPGVTSSAISVGLWTLNSQATNAANSSLTGNPSGVYSQNTDFTKAAQAVIDYVNAHGGAAGRKVVGVFHEINVANLVTASGRDQEQASACSDWTQDHHVFAMMEVPGGAGSFSCAQSTNTLELSDQGAGGQQPVDQAMFARMHDLYYAPNGIMDERRETDIANALWRQGFFAPNTKVGIMIENTPATVSSVANDMLPALAAHGIKPAVQITYPDIVNSPWQNYILQLQSAGVNRVIMSSSVGQYWASTFMMREADSAHYYPHWGIAADNGPVALNIEGAPASELALTQGMGWMPGMDIGSAAVQSANEAACEKLETSSGQGVAVATYCEDVLFLAFVLNHVQEVSPASFSAALTQIGSGYGSVYTIGGATQFSSSVHSGAAVERDFVYDPHCGQSGHFCFQYSGPSRPLP